MPVFMLSFGGYLFVVCWGVWTMWEDMIFRVCKGIQLGDVKSLRVCLLGFLP